MPSRLPKPTDFPPHLTLSITPPPPNQQPTNILLLLHGLGDTHAPFTRLAQQLNLPETACIALRGPTPLPDALGLARDAWHWGDDIVLDRATGGLDLVDVPYARSVALVLDDVVLRVLVRACGYALRDVMVYGFGQGGAVALGVARDVAVREALPGVAGDSGRGREMGGVVSVGGPLPAAFRAGDGRAGKSKTPVLVLHGSSGSAITASAAGDLKSAFEDAEVHRWEKAGDGMPASREEMLPIMRFFARRLRSRAGIPSGAVEIT